MSKLTKTATPTKTNRRYDVEMVPGIRARIVWARAANEEDTSGTQASFSMNLFAGDSETPFQTINKLTIRNTVDFNTQKPKTQIGSIYMRGSRGQTIYSNTFFPGSAQDTKIEEMRQTFVREIVEAVTLFIQDSVEDKNHLSELRTQPNPELAKLQSTIAQARTVARR